MKCLLIAVDFSDVSQRVLDTGLQMAQALGAEVYLIHVVEPEPTFLGHEVDPQVERDILARNIHVRHDQLDQMAESAGRAQVKVTALMVQGPIVQKVLEEAERLNADLIVMGTHGHGMLYQTLVGSVSAGVLRKAMCPVVMVPANSPSAGT